MVALQGTLPCFSRMSRQYIRSVLSLFLVVFDVVWKKYRMFGPGFHQWFSHDFHLVLL